MLTLVDRFRNAVAGSITEHYIRTVLAFLVSVKQRRGPKMRARPTTHYHAYRKYTECLRIQRRGGPCHCSRKFLLQTTFECLFSYYNVLYM